MIIKCIVCGKGFEALRPTKKTCSSVCRQKLHREVSTVTKVVPIVTKKGSTVTEIPIVTSTVTEMNNDERLAKLVFTEKQSIPERIKIYKDLFPEVNWVPNWIVNGFLTKDKALKNALDAVRKNLSISDLGIGID